MSSGFLIFQQFFPAVSLQPFIWPAMPRPGNSPLSPNKRRFLLDGLLFWVYTHPMKILRSSVYRKWYNKLADSQAKYRISLRVKRLAEGNPGDVKPVGEGVLEMRIDYGPGYRVYYKDAGEAIVILLCGGDKSTQTEDINRAKEIAAAYKPKRKE